jgi:hypothetical protein
MNIKAKPFDELIGCDYFICETQGLIFSLAIKMGFDDDDFIQKYMNSRFCTVEMDAPYDYFQMAEPEDSMDYILKEIKPEQNTQHYDEDAIKWIGYMYRYMHIRLGTGSDTLYRLLPLKDMLVYYVGMHTQDDEYFLDVMQERFGEEILCRI